MKRLLIITFGVLLILPSHAQQTKEAKKYSQWKNKSRFGITIAYDYRKFDHHYSLFSIYGAVPNRSRGENYNDSEGTFLFPGKYKIEKNTLDVIRLEVDYWIFSFLNLYAIGGRIDNHSRINTTLQTKDIKYPPFSSTIKYSGWEYGVGLKGEVRIKNFKPQIGYSIYWDDLDDIDDKSYTHTFDLKLGYTIPINKLWIKNIDIYAGGAYNYVKLKYGYYMFYDRGSTDQQTDISNVYVSYSIYNLLDQITLRNIHDWNLTTSVDIELYHRFHCQFDANFLGRRTSLSAAISYRLFPKK